MNKQLALDSFASLIAPVPGGIDIGGKVPATSSGTLAVRWLLGYYNELDEGQRVAVRSAILGDGDESRGGSSTSTIALRDMTLVDLPADMRAIVPRLESELKVRYPSLNIPDRVEVIFNTADNPKLSFSASPRSRAAGDDFATSGRSEFCTITVWFNGLALLDDVQKGRWPAWRVEMQLVHELVHCAQYGVSVDVANLFRERARDWVLEGSAEWAEYKYAYDKSATPYGDPLPDGFDDSKDDNWNKYLGRDKDNTSGGLRKSLFNRQYDALGFFAHIENSGLDPWSVITEMVVSVSLPGDNQTRDEAAFSKAYRIRDFASRWAMGMVRRPPLGPNWETFGPGITGYVPKLKTQVATDTELSFYVTAGATDRQEITFVDRNRKILVFDPSTSHVGLYWKGSATAQEVLPLSFPSAVRAYCLDPSGCTCPEGQAYSGEHELTSPPVPVLESLLVAFTGGARPGKVSVATMPLPCKPVLACSGNTDLRAHSSSGGVRQVTSPSSCPVPTCSAEAQQKVQAIIGETVESGRPFDSEGTYGCLWLQTAPVDLDDDFKGGPNGDYVILGRRAAEPKFEGAHSFETSFTSTYNNAVCNSDPGYTSITCTGELNQVTSAERWYGPNDVLATHVLVQTARNPISLALRILNEVPR